MDFSLRKRAVVTLLVIALLGAFAFGFLLGSGGGDVVSGDGRPRILPVFGQDRGRPSEVDFALFWDVWNELHESFADRQLLDTRSLVFGAIRGMVKAAGDPYTAFLPPEDSRLFRENVSGAFGGIGIEIGIRDDRLVVIAPLEGTPAKRAGLQAGDIIAAINAEPTDELSLDEAVQRIRGKRGTTVTLTVIRENGVQQGKDIAIVRDTIRIPVLEWSFADDAQGTETAIAHVRLFHFTETAAGEFRETVNELLARGAKGVVLDLRGNPGGFLEVAVDVASWFVDPQATVAIQKFGSGEEQRYTSAGHPALVNMPVVVLVDEGSASASEIVAGALRDVRGVTIVGTKTFGKGSVQELREFDGGSSLKVTVAKWLTPSGVSIQDNGIEPDVTVEPLKPAEGQAPAELPDVQLQKAVDMLK